MARPYRSRKHPIFVLLVLIFLSSLAVFTLTLSKIAKELKSSISISWTAYYTLVLTIITCVHAGTSVSIFDKLPARPKRCMSTFIVTCFLLSAAWTPATVAEIFDSNNDLVGKATHPSLEKLSSLKIRIILSGIISLFILSNALLAMHHSFRRPTKAMKLAAAAKRKSEGSRYASRVLHDGEHLEAAPLSVYVAELDSRPVSKAGSGATSFRTPPRHFLENWDVSHSSRHPSRSYVPCSQGTHSQDADTGYNAPLAAPGASDHRPWENVDLGNRGHMSGDHNLSGKRGVEASHDTSTALFPGSERRTWEDPQTDHDRRHAKKEHNMPERRLGFRENTDARHDPRWPTGNHQPPSQSRDSWGFDARYDPPATSLASSSADPRSWGSRQSSGGYDSPSGSTRHWGSVDAVYSPAKYALPPSTVSCSYASIQADSSNGRRAWREGQYQVGERRARDAGYSSAETQGSATRYQGAEITPLVPNFLER